MESQEILGKGVTVLDIHQDASISVYRYIDTQASWSCLLTMALESWLAIPFIIVCFRMAPSVLKGSVCFVEEDLHGTYRPWSSKQH